MNDLISRKYLYDKIAELEDDVRKIIVHQPKGSPEYLRCNSRLNELNEFKSEVRDAPSAENIPVVHCKDCEYWHKETGWCKWHSHFIDGDGNFCHPWESNDWKMFDENYFCSDGKRSV